MLEAVQLLIGILSYFAVRAGAQMVLAVEASNMADKIQKILDSTNTKNEWLKDKMKVVKGKIEEVGDSVKVDTLISEPIGVLLVHERMIVFNFNRNLTFMLVIDF